MKPSMPFCCSLVVLTLILSGSALAGEIHDAAKAGDLAKVKALVAANPAVVNLTEFGGPTPLHFAVAEGRTQVAEFLLVSKADPNAKLGSTHSAMLSGGVTPMHAAAAKGDVAMGRLLLKHKADVNLASDFIGPPLFVAVGHNQRAFVEFLLENKADPKAIQPAAGASLLHVAALLPQPDILRLLLARKLDVNRQMADGRTPLLMAAEAGNLAAAELLIAHGADVNVTDREGRSLLNKVRSDNKASPLVKLLEKSGAKDVVPLNTKLADAVSGGRTNEVAALLKQNPALVRTVASELYGQSLLHVAVEGGNAGMVRLLLDHKADVNAPDKRGRQPIHWAVQIERTNLIAHLLQAGADVNARGEQGATPLHESVKLARPELVEFLIKSGADVNARNNGGKTPRDVAASLGRTEIERVLQAHGGEGPPLETITPETIDAVVRGRLAEVEAFLKTNPDAAKATNRHGQTLLQQATVSDQVGIAKLLLDHGAEISRTNRTGLPLTQVVSSDAMFKLLLSRGLNLNERGRNGWTALHEAARRGDTNRVALLLRHGADPAVRELARGSTGPGRTPLELAESALRDPNLKVWAIHAGVDHEVVVKMLKPVTPARPPEAAAKKKMVATKPGEIPVEVIRSVNNGQLAEVEAFLDQHPDAVKWMNPNNGFTLLTGALLYDRVELAAMLLKRGADANMTTFQKTGVAVSVRSDEMMKLLLKAGMNINKTNPLGWTALHLSANAGVGDSVALLLANGADATLLDKQGRTALQVAETTPNATPGNKAKVVALLKPVTSERGAEPATTTTAAAKSPPPKPDQATATAEARAKAQAAARAAAERLAKDEADARAKAMELAKANTAKQATTPASASKPAPQENLSFPVQLVRAAVRNDAATIQELLKAHPEILNQNENGPGSTALHYAAYNGRLAAAKALLDGKPDVNLQNKAGYTALYEAARQGHKAIIALLLDYKADPNIRDKKGKSPLQAASEAKRQEVVDLLRASGAKD